MSESRVKTLFLPLKPTGSKRPANDRPRDNRNKSFAAGDAINQTIPNAWVQFSFYQHFLPTV
jgi:hypothetical protein